MKNRISCVMFFGVVASMHLWLNREACATAFVATNNGVANWSSSTTWSPNGVPGQNDSAEIRNGATVTVDTNISTTSACGSLIIDLGGAIRNVVTSGQSTLNIYGNLINSNTGSGGFALGGSSGTKLTFASGNVSWTGSGDTSAGKFYVIVNTGVTLDISRLTTGINFKSGTGSTTFTVSGTLIAGTQVLNANGNPNNTFVLNSGATLRTANTNGIYGPANSMLNYVTAPTLSTTANFLFYGIAPQASAGLPGIVNNLTISNSSGVTMSAGCMVNGILNLASGQLRTTPANLVTIGSAGSISGASANAFINGPLAQVYSGIAPINKLYPIGTNGNYRAVSLNMTTLATSPSTITITPHEPSTFGSSGVSGLSLFTNRDWTVASSAASGNTSTLTFDGTGFNPVNAAVIVDSTITTTNFFPVSNSGSNYSVSGVSLTGSSDFALGDCSPPSVTPSNLVATASVCSPVSLSWYPVNGASSYNVYRKTAGGSYGYSIVNSSSTNCTDPTASNGINYFYAVSAAAACGGESAKSPDSNPVTPSAGAYIITSPSSVTTGYNYTPSFNVTVVNAISNQWFLSTNNGASWDRVTTGTGGTNASYTTDFTTTNMNGNKYECVSYGCSGAVTSAPATLTINMVDQFDTLRLSWQTNLFNTGSSLSSIASKANGYWSTMDTNVSRTFLWSDLPFGSDSGNIVSSFNRLQSMALAWSIPGSSLQSNALLSAAVTGGLDWMNANVYTANTNQPQYSGSLNNWYDWEISGPLSLNNTVVLMYPALTGLQVSNYCRAIDNFGPDGNTAQPYFNWANLTGANTSDVVLNMILRGILGKSAGKTTEAQTNLSSVFPYVTSGDGFYTDGSFVFHGNIAYNGHYGFVLLGDIATLVNYLQGSTWQITDPSLSNVYSWIFNSFEPLLYNGAMMDMVRGRALSWSSSTETTDGSMVISDIQQIAKFAPTATATSLTAFANSPLLSPGQFHFYNMDRIVALRSGFGFGISMSSSRIANYENLFATSNLKAWFTGDGMTYLYLGNPDTQFTGDCWPTMDWYHLPGTTSETNATPQPGTTDQDWVGGAQLSGTYGVAGMAQHANNTTLYSRKSWFMFDNEVVCLGAGITCSDNNRIDTTVENRRLGASPTNNFWVNGTKIIPTVGWSSNLNSASWCSLDGVGGYYFPGGATNLQAAFLTNSGSWSQIKVGDSPTVYTDEFLQLYFKHGVKPTNATYAYVLLPNMTASDMSNYAFSPDIVVITNTPTIQAASKPLLGLVAANFWTGGNNSIGMITVNKQASVILQTNSTSFSVGISDPTQTNQGSITLTLNLAAYSVLSADPGVTVLQLRPQLVLSINVSTKPGATFQASFVTATNLINTMPPAIVSAGMVGLPSQFRIKFTGDTNYTQTVLGSTNLEIPITNWTVLGTAAQISNGLYQFTDGNVTNNSQRFYRIRSP